MEGRIEVLSGVAAEERVVVHETPAAGLRPEEASEEMPQ